MKRIHFSLIALTGLVITSCQSNGSLDQIVSQKYVHKYGFDVSEQEWEERELDGQVVNMLKNGVKVTHSYENGKMHGPSTYSFPHSAIIEKLLVYDQGSLLKETLYDLSGMPIREDLYEFDDRNLITLWDCNGVPLSFEEYENEVLIEGKYYTTEHILEAKVENGYGERVRRDRSGLLISRDRMENGLIAKRTSYHPTGEIHTVSHYHDYQLHGKQLKFTPSGRPLMELSWNHGVLDGEKVIYRNGIKAVEIPYSNGEKHGTEYHYDDLGNLTAEIAWHNDKKHGCCKSYTEESMESEWFYKGMSVNAQRFELLEMREQLVAELSMD